MAKIVIIGNSMAGFSACETLIKNSSGNEITLISKESFPAYRRNLLLDYLAGNVKEDELFLCDEDFYKANNINFQKTQEVIRLDTKKQRLHLKDNSKIDYDYLIITSGQRISIPDIPGKTKEGVFALYSIEDVKLAKEMLPVTNTVCVIGPKKIAVHLANILALKGKEVKVIIQDGVSNYSSTQNLEFIDNLTPQEFIGEGQLQALKLNNGKIIGTSLALFLGGYTASSEFVRETEIKTYQGYILVDNLMRTNLENVFSAGSVCRKNEAVLLKEKAWKEVVSEGVLAAQSIIRLARGETLCQSY